MRSTSRFSIERGVPRCCSAGAIDIGDRAPPSILLIFSLQLIREDRSRNVGFRPYRIVCHNRSPLQYVPTRDFYIAMKKSLERSARGLPPLVSRGNPHASATARWLQRNRGWEIRSKHTWQMSRDIHPHTRKAFDGVSAGSARRSGNTFRRNKREERVLRVSSPEADYSRFARRDETAEPAAPLGHAWC